MLRALSCLSIAQAASEIQPQSQILYESLESLVRAQLCDRKRFMNQFISMFIHHPAA
jgi:hypothetical protein